MKEMKCPDCDKIFKANSPDEMMKAMHPHYMEDHAEIVKNGDEEQRKAWMEKFNKDFEDAEEVE
jgi:uncharacterized C2H2 Zn-finger protein